ncbi:hypothetical protein D9613_008979 [Agrocybe pediades]|uniref:Tc1-like transposase DDE domain-containing protein n=1 Tax=Agrocybe pediades TaxID=84607 RepID=A0A8H4VUC7_9AGAR|nr:hypothetical protein D9613_008979 [Agrocybe pediades]
MKGRKGPLVVLEYPGGRGGGMNSKRYREQVLDPVLKSFYKRVSKKQDGVEFQQDNAPSHRSKTTRQWFSDNQVRLFYHPPNSPDLNPIERVWWEIKKRLKDREQIPTTAEQLIVAVKEIWNELPVQEIDKHIDSMGKRAKAIFATKGGHIPF